MQYKCLCAWSQYRKNGFGISSFFSKEVVSGPGFFGVQVTFFISVPLGYKLCYGSNSFVYVVIRVIVFLR